MADCDESYQVYTNPGVDAVLGLVLSLNLTALVLNLHVSYGIWISKTLHCHAKILFLHLSVLIICRTVLTSIRATIFIFYPLVSTDKCDLVWSHIKCKLFAEMCKTPLELILYAFLAVSCERMIATFLYQKYEVNNNKLLCFAVGVLIPWIPGIVTFYLQTRFHGRDQTSVVAYCTSLTSGAHDFGFLLKIQVPLCVVCMLICSATLYLSRKKKKNSTSLSGRYQLFENIRITKLIVPNIIGYCITLLVHIGSMYVVSEQSHDNLTQFAVAKEWTSFILPVYANFYCLTFICASNEFTKYGLFKRLSRFRRQRIAPLSTTNDYFKSYQSQWK